MKKPRVEDLLMVRLFAPRKDLDPNDWQTHVRRNIVHEVRAETLRFYGPTDCLEAQYPGLDYNDPAHRLRLSQFPYHRRLFRAFDQLQLTDDEIQRLCKWEGTRHAREAYEASNRIKIRDTTWDGVTDRRERPTTATRILLRGGHIGTENAEPAENLGSKDEDEEMACSNGQEEVSEEESEDEMQQSVGVELNQRLLAATEARARGEDVVIDADWEQWLKEAAERGVRPDVLQSAEATSVSAHTPQNLSYSGREIPEYLSGNLTPEMAAVRASLPPLPQYFPQETSDAQRATTSVLPLTPQAGTAL